MKKKIDLKERLLPVDENGTFADYLLTSKEVQNILSCSPASLHVYVKQGRLKAYRMGKRTLRFKRSDLFEFLVLAK